MIKIENRPSYPQRSGQRFTTNFSDEIYTVKSFFGDSGIEYDSLDECIEQNTSSRICIKTKEYEGDVKLIYSFLVIG